MVVGEQQGHVHRYARGDRLLDGRQALLGARDLDEQVRSRCPRVQIAGGGQCARRVVRQPRRHLQRHPAVESTAAVIHRPAEVGGPHKVFDGEFEEEVLASKPLLHLRSDRGVVGGAVLNCEVVDRGVARQAGHGEVTDVTGERAVIEHRSCDVVEPETLAEMVQGGRDGGHEDLVECEESGRRSRADKQVTRRHVR